MKNPAKFHNVAGEMYRVTKNRKQCKDMKIRTHFPTCPDLTMKKLLFTDSNGKYKKTGRVSQQARKNIINYEYM